MPKISHKPRQCILFILASIYFWIFFGDITGLKLVKFSGIEEWITYSFVPLGIFFIIGYWPQKEIPLKKSKLSHNSKFNYSRLFFILAIVLLALFYFDTIPKHPFILTLALYLMLLFMGVGLYLFPTIFAIQNFGIKGFKVKSEDIAELIEGFIEDKTLEETYSWSDYLALNSWGEEKLNKLQDVMLTVRANFPGQEGDKYCSELGIKFLREISKTIRRKNWNIGEIYKLEKNFKRKTGVKT